MSAHDSTVNEGPNARSHSNPKLALKPWIPTSPPKRILFVNALLVDPRTSNVPGCNVTLSTDGRVQDVKLGSAAHNNIDLKVDLDGKYFLCPGLIDCHVHVTAVPGVDNIKDAMNLSTETVALRSTYILKEMLSRGFTTVRDTGGASAELANVTEEWLVPGPRIIPCGKALSQTGGHGDFRAIDGTSCCGGHDPAGGLGVTCDGVPEVLSAVRDNIRRGAKFIKVMVGGGVASPTDTLESVQFTSSELSAITEVCENMGSIHTTAHAYTPHAIRHAISNGIKGIEHGNFIDNPTAKLMAEKGIYLTPTLSCYEIMTRPPFEHFLPESGKKKNKEVMDSGLKAIKIAADAGVTICYGSDLLVSMHALQTEEFTVRARALPSSEILKHATINAAKMLKMERQIGEIVSGAFSDLIILDKNPLEDITILDKGGAHVKAVIKGGYVFKSELNGLPVDVIS